MMPNSLSGIGGGGGMPAAGLAGLDVGEVRERWAEEARHVMRSPGSFEWWHFHCLNAAGDGVQLTLFEGLPFHPFYVTQVNRHDRRLVKSPFDKVQPNVQGSHYPAAHFAVFSGGKRVAQFLNLYPPLSTSGDPASLDLRIGPNRVTLRQDGTFGITARGYPFDILRGQPLPRLDRMLSAKLEFVPTFPGVAHTRPFRAPTPAGASHYWSLAAPHGVMSGTVQMMDRKENVLVMEQKVEGIGYHDHVYGQGSLAAGIKKILWGFIQGENWTAAWHQSVTGKQDHADGLIFFERGQLPVVIDAPESKLEKRKVSRWLLGHYGRILMHGSTAQGHTAELVLNNHTMMSSVPFHSGIAATGTLTMPGHGSYTGNGMTHLLKLQRLQWPVLSDVTLRAITTVSEDDPLWRA